MEEEVPEVLEETAATQVVPLLVLQVVEEFSPVRVGLVLIPRMILVLGHTTRLMVPVAVRVEVVR